MLVENVSYYPAHDDRLVSAHYYRLVYVTYVLCAFHSVPVSVFSNIVLCVYL